MDSMRKAALRRSAMAAVTPPYALRATVESHKRQCEDKAELGVIARGLRRETRLSGEPLRVLAVALRNRRYTWGVNYAAVDAVPDSALGGRVGEIRARGVYYEVVDGCEPHPWSARWAEGFHPGNGVRALILTALTDAIRMDIGEVDALRLLGRTGPISGYLASDLAAWMAGRHGEAGQYERCSGGEMYTWLRYHPEHWASLVARMPVGAVAETAIQCYPHETAMADACHAVGLFHIFRLNDSIYSGTPEQIIAAVGVAKERGVAL